MGLIDTGCYIAVAIILALFLVGVAMQTLLLHYISTATKKSCEGGGGGLGTRVITTEVGPNIIVSQPVMRIAGLSVILK